MNTYQSKISFGNGHIDTIVPALFRIVPKVSYERERIKTTDDDFLDLDWSYAKKKSNKVVILSHGLESSSNAKYIRGMVRHFNSEDYDACAWNCRGCSGEVNYSLGYYHSGVSHDLRDIINFILQNKNYDEIYLIGFSMGGNISLKYLGEESSSLPKQVKAACVFSTPCDLESASFELKKGMSQIYTKNFLYTLKQKVRDKKEKLEEFGIQTSRVLSAKNLPELDELLTAPLFNFQDAKDYYVKSSSKQFIAHIKVPTLIVNAKNDPFLGDDCYPHQEASENQYITLETPNTGGHCGFHTFAKTYWSEQRSLDFFNQ